jgi:hypothetical protein
MQEKQPKEERYKANVKYIIQQMMLDNLIPEAAEPYLVFSSSRDFFDFFDYCFQQQLYIALELKFRYIYGGRLFAVNVSREYTLMGVSVEQSKRVWCLDKAPASDLLWWRFIYKHHLFENRIVQSVQRLHDVFIFT